MENFDPDRWDSIQPGPSHYVSFGGGQHGCLGKQKTLAEAPYTVIRLARSFEEIESGDEQDWAGDQKLTTKNVHGRKLAFKR